MTVIEHRGPVSGAIIKGDTVATGADRPYRDTEEPTNAEAAALVRELMGAGVVDRLDMVLDALRAAYRRGQAAERTASDRLAAEAAAAFAADAQALAARHAGQFAQAHQDRAAALAAHDALPWYLKQ